jgi:hypothetical protein
MGFLDDAPIPIPCPGCGRKTEKTIGWLKDNRQFTCECGAVINLQSDDFREGIGKADKAWSELERAIKKLGDES